jgi:hypothetical protein
MLCYADFQTQIHMDVYVGNQNIQLVPDYSAKLRVSLHA